VRIERLWVDVTAQVGATWADHFVMLELSFGLNINNANHIWLLHHLFLPVINSILSFFAQSWNEHKIDIRDGPNRSPADMFGFDMLVHGIRGDALPNDDISQDELEVFGVDWEALRDENLLQSQRDNNDPLEQPDTWLGRVGPPPNLNEVLVNAPQAEAPFTLMEIQSIDNAVSSWIGSGDDHSITQTWIHGLATAWNLRPGLF
jgi:hypothetical protein